MPSCQRKLILGALGYFITCSSFDVLRTFLKHLFRLITAKLMDEDIVNGKDRLISLINTLAENAQLAK